MNINFLDFEQPIAELEAKIRELRLVSDDGGVNLTEEIERLEVKCNDLLQKTFSNLTDWQIVQLARHPLRPYFLDYLPLIFTDFQQLHGDRLYRDDPAIVGGTAWLDNIPVMVIGQQKGRDTKEKIVRNFGMSNPEGYRKVQRLLRLAAKFSLPVFTFIDTAGAFPGVGAEERGQSEAIAACLALASDLPVPIISTVIGEGGSGGALALSVGDRLLMLQYSIYSVISPEGCASILFKDAQKAELAATAMGVTAPQILQHKLIDKIVAEPLGAAHRNLNLMAATLKNELLAQYHEVQNLESQELIEARYQRLRQIGSFVNEAQ